MSAVLVALQLMSSAVMASAPTAGLVSQPGRDAPPPYGYVVFCAENPVECGHPGAPAGASAKVRAEALAPYWNEVFAQASRGPGPAPGAVTRSTVVRRLASAIEAVEVGGEGDPLAYTPALERQLKKVNRSVNWKIRPRTDAQVFGVSDYWVLPLDGRHSREGDCEDYVLQKRSFLRQAGVRIDQMSVAIVRTASDATHAVLLVNTDRGVLVLDNLTASIVPLERAPYTIVLRQVFGQPDHWRAGAA